MSAEKPVVELATSLLKGAPFQQSFDDGYNLIFSVAPVSGTLRQGNIKALENLLIRCPDANRGLSLTRTSEETTTSFQQDSVGKKEVKKELYEIKFEGSFEIPWSVNVKVINGEVVVDYQARLTRPDLSLDYLLKQSKKPSFRHPLHYGTEDKKGKTRIDGLPVWLSIHDWKKINIAHPQGVPIEKDVPNNLSLAHKGLKTARFSRRDEEEASLTHADRFIGTWHERWFLYEDAGQRGVQYMEVRLKGCWEDNLPSR
ncbi:MAG: hypothetical protein Q7R49_00015 [Candidatus Daviesbacteria bacterium]|nr:hypothetical protein [Candidatus Daviesbacteria bacterium]